MNYIETPDGVKRPFRFSWKALRRLANELGLVKLSELPTAMTDLPIDKMSYFVHLGFEHGAKRDGIAIDFKADDVEDWLDERFSIFQEAMEAFSKDFGAGVDEGNAIEAKGKK